jgi:hypothetical protein
VIVPVDTLYMIILLALLWALIRLVRAINAHADAVRGHTWLLRALQKTLRATDEEDAWPLK